MGVIPTTIAEQLQFGEAHIAPWQGNTAAIGLSPASVTAIKNAVMDCRAKFDAANAARLASKAATNALRVSTDTMHVLLSDAVQTIRIFADSTHNPNVFTLAQIPAPAAPTPAPPPMQPTELGASILPTGALRITFKATDTAQGATTYLVSRKLSGQTAFTVIGSAGSSQSTGGASLPRGFKFFDDVTLPSGSNHMQYMVQGQRGSVFGMPSEVFIVNIGVGGGGGLADVSAELKMAA